MKRFLTAKSLPWAVLTAGIISGICRGLLFASGIDEKGLLVSSHFANIILWIISIGVTALLLLGTWNLKQATKYLFNFPGSIPGSLGAAAAGISLLIYSITTLFSSENGLTSAVGIAGILGAAALGFLSFCRWKGLHPSALFHMVLCVFFMLDLVCQYQLWSADPQLQDYLFSLLALVFALLSCYFSATFAAGDGNRRAHTLVHLAAVYCCLVTLPHCDTPLLFAAIALWLFTDLCNLTPMRHSHQPEEG